jgi:glycosyltransferase involved in cell wall biosynthesis
LSDIALRDHLSIAGRLRAAEFTWERTALETLKVYQLVGAKS